MKIKKENRDEIKTSLTTWAKANKAKLKEQGEAFIVEKNGWLLEVLPENGWAYLHGGGLLNGISTNISSMDEFDAAVKRLIRR